jgi:hypothetical protein
MNAFTNVRIYPNHGGRAATVTWELSAGVEEGLVYVAFSYEGVKGSWVPRNPNTPVASSIGMYADPDLVMNAGTLDGFYRLMLITNSGTEYLSEPIQILGDLTPAEYGQVRAMIHQEYTQMRVTNGWPIWHCIPRTHGEPAASADPDTGETPGIECEADPSEMGFGLPFKGGYYPPVLTWMRVLKHEEGLQDDDEEFSPSEIDKTAVRMMAFPRPRRNHLIVDPTTDRRYLVTDEVKPYRHRGVISIAYECTLEFLQQHDPRYKFPVPFIDTRQYRRIPYWNPSQLTP